MLFTSIMSLLLYTSNNNRSLIEYKRTVNVTALSVVYVLSVAWYSYSPAFIGSGVLIYNDNFLLTNYSVLIKALIALLALLYLVVLYAYNTVNQTGMISKEFLVILMFNVLGLALFTESITAMSVFVTIELQSYTIYLLTSLYSSSKFSYFSSKYGLIYFLLGSLASLLILFGLTILYAETGLVSLLDINHLLLSLSNVREHQCVLAVLFILLGLFFKLGLAPLHNWVINVYANIPNYTTLWISIAPKIALLTFVYTFHSTVISALSPEYGQYITYFILSVIVLSMVVGAVGGLSQFNLKRILAYSALANSAYLLLAILAANQLSLFSYLFFLLQYSLTHVLIFSCVIYLTMYYSKWIVGKRLAAKQPSSTTFNYTNSVYLTDLYGLLRQNKALTFVVIVCMSSFIGIPPLTGFYAKFFVLISALLSNYWLVSLLLILASLVTAYYYAFIIKSLYSSDTSEVQVIATPNIALSYIISVLCLLVLYPLGYMDLYQNGILIVSYLS